MDERLTKNYMQRFQSPVVNGVAAATDNDQGVFKEKKMKPSKSLSIAHTFRQECILHGWSECCDWRVVEQRFH